MSAGTCSVNFADSYMRWEVLVDGQQRGLLPSVGMNAATSNRFYSAWQSNDIVIDPAREHILTLRIVDSYAANYNRAYSHELYVKNFQIQGRGSSSTIAGDYAVRIHKISSDRSWDARVEDFGVLMNGQIPHLLLQTSSNYFWMGGQMLIPRDASGTAIAPRDFLGGFVSFNGGAGQPVVVNGESFSKIFDTGGARMFSVSAGENYRYNNQNQTPLIYTLNVATDSSAPQSNLSQTVLETLPGIILPWLGAQMPFNLRDDLQLKGLKITNTAGSTEVFKTDFATNAYSYGAVTNPFVGRVVLNSTEVSRVPAVAAGGNGINALSSLSLKLDVEDLTGRHWNTTLASSVFNIPSDAKIICDRYNLSVGDTTGCRWDRLPRNGAYLPSGVKVVFKVWKREEGRNTEKNNFILAVPEGMSSTQFTARECGQYDVEAVLLTNNNKYLGKRTSNIARFNVPCIPVRPAVAVGLDTKVLICPGVLPCGQNDDNVQNFDIYRRLVTTGNEYQKIATVMRRDFLDRCYIDESAQRNQAYLYQIQGNLPNNVKTNKSEGDRADVKSYQSKFQFRFVPKQIVNAEMPFEISAWINSQSPLAGLPVRLFPSDAVGDYQFMTASAAGARNPTPVDIGNNGLLLTTGGLRSRNESKAIGWLQFSDSTYAQPGTRGLEIMLGDLAEDYPKLKREYVDIALGAMTANIEEIPMERYQTHGEALSYNTSRSLLVYDLKVPVIPTDIVEALEKFYFNQREATGLLVSSAWRSWADEHKAELFNAATDMTDLRYLEPTYNPDGALPIAQALASADAIRMAAWDAEPGHCFFGTECTLNDQLSYHGDHIFGRYLYPFLESVGSLSEVDATAIAGGDSSMLTSFMKIELDLLNHMSNPSLIAAFNSIRFELPSNLPKQLGVADPAVVAKYNQVYRPFYSKLLGVGSATAKGFVAGAVIDAHTAGSILICAAYKVASEYAANFTQCLANYEQGLVWGLSKLGLAEISDPYEETAYTYGAILPAAFSIVLSPAEAATGAQRIIGKMRTPFKIIPPGTTREVEVLTLQAEKEATGEVVDSITLAKEGDTLKIVAERDLDPRTESEMVTDDNVEDFLARMAIKYRAKRLVEDVVSPLNPLNDDLVEAFAVGGDAPRTVAACGENGRVAFKAGLIEPQVTSSGQATFKIVHREPGPPAIAFPSVDYSNLPTTIVDTAEHVSRPVTSVRVPPGTSFFRADQYFGDINDVNAAMDYARSLFRDGIPGNYRNPLWNFTTREPVCSMKAITMPSGRIKLRGGQGSGPIPEVGWRSTIETRQGAQMYGTVHLDDEASGIRILVEGRVPSWDKGAAYYDGAAKGEREITFFNGIQPDTITKIDLINSSTGQVLHTITAK
ncbi:MAG: hypothetical protein Q7T03_01190 [Deltaproteobacteria bacterium]|nr:hypothetical protein [Deltaproteobacteria bacterium]